MASTEDPAQVKAAGDEPGSAAGCPEVLASPRPALALYVVDTGPHATREALRHAAKLGRGLHASLHLLVPVVVPLGFPLDRPPVAPEWQRRRSESLARAAGEDVQVHVCHCRERVEALRQTLPPRSLAVVAGRVSWWRRDVRRLVSELRRLGHQVTFIPLGGSRA